MKTRHRNYHPNDSLTPKQRRLPPASLRLLTALCKLLVPLILGISLGFPLTTDAATQDLDAVITVANHDSTAAAVGEGGTIETHLECAVDEQGRPAPPCKQCEATTKKLTTSTGTTSGVRVDFTFRHDDGVPYVGEIEIEVHRPEGTTLVVHEDVITVLDGQTISVDLDNDQMCNFDQVEWVTYRLLTPQPW